jgi:hypothetical protein
VPPSYSQDVPNETGSEREALNVSRERLVARLEMLQKQESVLDQYSEGRLSKPADLEAFLDLYSARRLSIYEQRSAVEKELIHIDKKLSELDDHANTLRAEMQSTGITVVIFAREDGPSTLILSYGESRLQFYFPSCILTWNIHSLVVTQASWFSLYDVRAKLYPASETSTAPASPTVNLLYRANIKQTTGEDWKGVSLTLSTASPTLGTPIPTFEPWQISPAKSTRRRRGAISEASDPRPSTVKRKRAAVEDDEYVDFALFDEGPAITVNHSAIDTSYSVEGLSTITSDESWHRVSIAVSFSFHWLLMQSLNHSSGS